MNNKLFTIVALLACYANSKATLNETKTIARRASWLAQNSGYFDGKLLEPSPVIPPTLHEVRESSPGSKERRRSQYLKKQYKRRQKAKNTERKQPRRSNKQNK